VSLFRLDCSFQSADSLSLRARHTEATTGDRSIRTSRRKKMSLACEIEDYPRRSGNGLPRTLCALLLLSALVKHAFGARGFTAARPRVTPLADLLQEARRTIRRLKRRGKLASGQTIPTQVSTLPTRSSHCSHLSVGSRGRSRLHQQRLRYLGFASRRNSLSGKLKLRGEIAKTRSGRFAATNRIRCAERACRVKGSISVGISQKRS